MPRDIAGDYTLPLPDVVDGTTIDSTWANPTNDDIAVALTASLDRYGRGGMNVPLENNDGTVNAPGITWANESSSGFYRAALNDFRAAISGIDTARFIDDTGSPAGSQKPVEIWDGQAWQKPLYGGENVSFGAMTLEGTGDMLVNGDASLTGNLNMNGGANDIFLPGNFGIVIGDSVPLSTGSINIISVADTGVGTYRITFARDLFGSPNCIVLSSGLNDGFGTTFPSWTSFSANAIDINTGDDVRNWMIMAVLVDA